jgi:hypothetical protein
LRQTHISRWANYGRDQRGTLAPINACRSLGAVAHVGDLLAQLDEDNVRRGRKFERISSGF